MSIAEKLIEELEKDPKIRRRLAELMVTDSDVRLAVINAVLADVATKKDLKELEERFRNEMQREVSKLEERLRSELQREVRRLEERISALESRISTLEKRMEALEVRVNSIEARIAKLEGQMDLFVRLFVAFNLPTLIAVIGILLRMVFS